MASLRPMLDLQNFTVFSNDNTGSLGHRQAKLGRHILTNWDVIRTKLNTSPKLTKPAKANRVKGLPLGWFQCMPTFIKTSILQ